MLSHFIKTVVLLSTLQSAYVFAGSMNDSESHRSKQQTKSIQEMDHGAMDHNKVPNAGHNEGHQHDDEGSSVGEPASAAEATKTIRVITMDTMRYEFSPKPNLKAGDIVKFIVNNQGNTPHEFSIGDENEQKAHGKMMRKMPNMVHEDGNTVTVKPGETRELTWKFKGDNKVVFACNIPGHYEAGMFKEIVLTK